MKVGLGFIGDSPISEIVQYAQDAEKLGLDSLWLHDNMFYLDGLSYLIAASQRTSRIRMGIGCLNPYTRHPFAIGMSLLNLHGASQGRAILGLGTGSLGRLDQIGVKHDTPIDCLREAIDICRLVWRGDEFNYSGKVFTLNGVKSMVGGSSSKIPIYVAANKPQMLALTAKFGDGYLSSGFEAPATILRKVSKIREIAQQSKRQTGEIEIASYLMTLIGKTKADAFASAKRHPFVMYMLSIKDESFYIEAGINPQLKVPIATNYFKGNLSKASSSVTDEIISAFTVCGTVEQVVERVKEYKTAGVDLPILQPLGKEREQIHHVLGAASIIARE